MFEPTLKELAHKCLEWGIKLDEEKLENSLNKVKGAEKYSRWDLTREIVSKTLKEYYMDDVPWSSKWINSFESAQLCARFPELKPEQQEILLKDNNEFYAEQKFDGNRCTIMYSPQEGFKFYANNRDTQNLLISDNTPQILLIRNGIETTPEDYIGKFNVTFALDSEIICKSKYVDATAWGGELSNSELSACGILLQIQPEISHEIQRTQKGCQLEFHVFDIRYCNRDIMNEPLYKRNKVRDALMEKLSKLNLPFYNVPRVYTDKKGFFERITSEENKEGVIFKCENGIYTPNKTRGKLHQIKWKRSVTQMLGGEDIDGFIIGHENATEGKRFAEAGLIGGIKLGVYLNTIEGEEKIHHIASITGIPDNLRKKLSITDKETGKPILNPDYMYKVLTFDGFTVSPKNLRFTHARVEDWNTCWRYDKTPDMCKLEEEILRTQIL